MDHVTAAGAHPKTMFEYVVNIETRVQVVLEP